MSVSSTPAQPTIVAMQGRIQKVLRPASRLPFFRSPHSFHEQWLIEGTSAAFLSGLEAGLLADSPRADSFVFQLDSVSSSPEHGSARATVLCFTPLGWLDVAILRLEDNAPGGTCTCRVRYFSAGLFPLIVPGAVLLNCLFFFAPFWHANLPQEKTLPAIRSTSGLKIEVQSSGYLL